MGEGGGGQRGVSDKEKGSRPQKGMPSLGRRQWVKKPEDRFDWQKKKQNQPTKKTSGPHRGRGNVALSLARGGYQAERQRADTPGTRKTESKRGSSRPNSLGRGEIGGSSSVHRKESDLRLEEERTADYILIVLSKQRRNPPRLAFRKSQLCGRSRPGDPREGVGKRMRTSFWQEQAVRALPPNPPTPRNPNPPPHRPTAPTQHPPPPPGGWVFGFVGLGARTWGL